MNREVNPMIGFADSELVEYSRDIDCVRVVVRLWNDETLVVRFEEVIGLVDYNAGDFTALVHGHTESATLKSALDRIYDLVPSDHPYKAYAFLDLDGRPGLEIVAISVEISRSAERDSPDSPEGKLGGG